MFFAFSEPILIGRCFDMRELFFGIAVIPGVALVVGGTPVHMRLGIAVGVLAAFWAAVFGTLNKRFIAHSDALNVTGLEMGAGAICLTIVASFSSPGTVLVMPGPHDALLLFVLAIGCTLLPFALSLVALRHLSAFTTALAVNMEPVYAVLLAVILLGEQHELNTAFYAGVAIVFAAVFSHPLLTRTGSSTIH